MLRKRGFTLIELLVVIAIIAILAAILFPVFAQAREKARAISCISNEKQMGLAFMQYVQDYDETYPYAQYAPNNDPNATARLWTTFIYPYIKNGDTNYDNYGEFTWGTTGVFMCPSFPMPNQGSPYAVNVVMCPIGAYPQNPGYVPPTPPTLAALQTPSDTVLVAEMGVNDGGGSYSIFDPEEDYWTDTVGNPPGSYNGAHYDLGGVNGGDSGIGAEGGDCDATADAIAAQNYSYPGCGMFPRYRHSNTSNFIFTDGHAKAIVRGQLNWYKNIYLPGLMPPAV